MMSALPPRSGESPSRRGGGVSRLAMMQARFQAKQLEEKEEKLIHMLEEKQAGYFLICFRDLPFNNFLLKLFYIYSEAGTSKTGRNHSKS